MKTAEQIANDTDSTYRLANIRAINKAYRAQDESHLWPISGKFNVTDRAIRRVRKMAQYNGGIYGLEYCYSIEHVISEIVNGQL